MKEGEQERAKEELKEEAHKLEEEKQTYQVETEKLSDELGPLRERVRGLEQENEEFKSKNELYEAALEENRSLRSDNSDRETQCQELQVGQTKIRLCLPTRHSKLTHFDALLPAVCGRFFFCFPSCAAERVRGSQKGARPSQERART